MKRIISSAAIFSLGGFFMIAYQNCAEIDPSYVYDDNVIHQQQKLVDNSFIEMSNLKIQHSALTSFNEGLAYQLSAEFRVKYTNHFLGLEPRLEDTELFVYSGDNMILTLNTDKIRLHQRECYESIKENGSTYFDCVYELQTKQVLSRNPNLLKTKDLHIGNRDQKLVILLDKYEENLGGKSFKISAMYDNQYTPVKEAPKRMLAESQARSVKKVRKQKTKITKVKQPQRKVVEVKKKTPLPEGLFCHIQVLNPPHLELLSDVKKVGEYYSDRNNCRQVAIRISQNYCDRSLMGEIDYSLSIKNNQGGRVRVLNKEIDSIDCEKENSRGLAQRNF